MTTPTHTQNFSGYWRLLKHDNLDAFLKEAKFPWVMRKVMVKYASKSVDIISHQGSAMRITSANAKTSWTRALQEGREISQRDAEGSVVKTSSWWEGDCHKARMEGGKHGVLESWRHMDGGLMVVRTTLKPRQGREVSVIWYMEEMSVPGSGTPEQILQDQKRIDRATSKDNLYAQKMLQTKDKWVTPADRYLSISSDSTRKDGLLSLVSRSTSPLSSIVSPYSNVSPRASMTPAEPAQPNGHASVQPHQAQPSAARPQRVLSSGTLSDGERSDQGTTSHRHSRKPSEEEASEAPGAVFCPPGQTGGAGMTTAEKQPIHGTLHRRAGSLGQMSDLGAEKSVASGSRLKQTPESLEAQLSQKLQEYSENRSLTSVLPVENPLASDEPELLEMSPEEAEGTQLKMAEMEREAAKIALKRQKYAAGHTLCCCTLVFHSFVIPPYVRDWDL